MAPLEGALACGVSAGLFVFGLAMRDIQRNAANGGPLQPIARLGYSIYLIHAIVIPLVGVFIVGSLGSPELEIAAMIASTYALTIAAACVTNPLIERRLGNWIDQHASSPRPVRETRSLG